MIKIVDKFVVERSGKYVSQTAEWAVVLHDQCSHDCWPTIAECDTEFEAMCIARALNAVANSFADET